MSEMGEEVKAMEPQMRAEQAAPQPSVQGAAPAPLPPFLQNVPEPEPEPERMPLTTVHEGLAGESDEEATGLQNRREWSEQPKRQRHQTWMQDRADRKDMARTCSWVPDRAEDEDVWAAHVLQNAVRKSKARKEANNRRGVRDLGLALTNAAKDGKHHPEMWEDMSEMVQSTLKVPAEARTDVKLKLLRGFCRDVGIFGRLDIDRDDAVETQRNLCRRMQYRAFHSHEVIFEQGSHGDTAFVLLAGSVKITVHGRLVRSIKFGECFCMGAVANGDTERPAAALAESGAAVLTLTRSDYLECMDTLLEEAMVCLKKSPEERRDVDLEMIQAMLASAPFFKRLHYEQPQRLCCRHMRLRLAESGDTVFSFGDEGDQFFYIVDGEVGVVLNDEEVKRLGKTESFGEAALLGSSPLERRRTATIRATQRCVFATMNREEYLRINQEFEDSVAGILVRTPQQRTEEHLRQLTKMFGGIEFFERLEFELAQHSALRYLRYEACPAGHELFHSGEAGDKFYVIVRGEVKIMEGSMMRSKELKEVARLRSGEDFGERGIIDEDKGNRVRTAHAITTQPCVLATLERQAYVFVTEIMTMKPLIDRFWLVAAEVEDSEVWASARTEELPLFIHFAQFRRFELRMMRSFAKESQETDMAGDGPSEETEKAVQAKWETLTSLVGGGSGDVLSYNTFEANLFSQFYDLLGGIQEASLYDVCLKDVLDNISKPRRIPGSEVDVLVHKKLEAVTSQRKLMLHHRHKFIKEEAAMVYKQQMDEMESRAKWRDPDKGVMTKQILPALKSIKAEAREAMEAQAALNGEAMPTDEEVDAKALEMLEQQKEEHDLAHEAEKEAEEVSHEKLETSHWKKVKALTLIHGIHAMKQVEKPPGKPEKEENVARNRLIGAASTVLNKVFADRMSRGGYSLRTVVEAAKTREQMIKRQQGVDKHLLNRRQRAHAIMSGVDVNAEKTSFMSEARMTQSLADSLDRAAQQKRAGDRAAAKERAAAAREREAMQRAAAQQARAERAEAARVEASEREALAKIAQRKAAEAAAATSGSEAPALPGGKDDGVRSRPPERDDGLLARKAMRTSSSAVDDTAGAKGGGDGQEYSPKYSTAERRTFKLAQVNSPLHSPGLGSPRLPSRDKKKGGSSTATRDALRRQKPPKPEKALSPTDRTAAVHGVLNNPELWPQHGQQQQPGGSSVRPVVTNGACTPSDMARSQLDFYGSRARSLLWWEDEKEDRSSRKRKQARRPTDLSQQEAPWVTPDILHLTSPSPSRAAARRSLSPLPSPPRLDGELLQEVFPRTPDWPLPLRHEKSQESQEWDDFFQGHELPLADEHKQADLALPLQPPPPVAHVQQLELGMAAPKPTRGAEAVARQMELAVPKAPKPAKQKKAESKPPLDTYLQSPDFSGVSDWGAAPWSPMDDVRIVAMGKPLTTPMVGGGVTISP